MIHEDLLAGEGLAAIVRPGYSDAAASEFLAFFSGVIGVTLVEPRGIESSLGRSDKDIEALAGAVDQRLRARRNSCPRQSNARSRSCRCSFFPAAPCNSTKRPVGSATILGRASPLASMTLPNIGHHDGRLESSCHYRGKTPRKPFRPRKTRPKAARLSRMSAPRSERIAASPRRRPVEGPRGSCERGVRARRRAPSAPVLPRATAWSRLPPAAQMQWLSLAYPVTWAPPLIFAAHGLNGI